MTIERRIVSFQSQPVKLEKRTGADGKETTVCSGYAAVFFNAADAGTEYELYPGMHERVMPGCFDRCIREGQDVRGLFNHEPDHLLGRVTAGTMRLSLDVKGLRYEIDLPDTHCGRDVATMIERGDLTGSSFSFSIVRQTWHFNDDPDSEVDDVRELLDVDVYDVGPVSFPAYQATTTGIRAVGDLAEVRCACDQARTEQRGAVTYAQGPMIRSDAWDEDAARARVRSWASAGDQMDYRKFSRAFVHHDGTATEAGYRGLHHDVRDGKLHVHTGGVEHCCRMLDADGGGGIPEADRAACLSHLQRHRDAVEDDELEDDDESDLDDGDADRQRAAAERERQLRLAEVA